MTPAGFPHSEIHGSKPACGSPWLFAAYHVLRRLLVPRHPPYALCSLIGSFDMIFLHLKYTFRYTRRSVSSLAFLANCRMSSEFAFRFSFLRSFSQFSSVCSFQGALWWRWSDLNRRPPACKAGALPAELHPHVPTSAFAHTGFRPRLSHAYLSA